MFIAVETGGKIDKEFLTKNFNISNVLSITAIDIINPEWQKKSMVITSTMWKELSTINREEKVKNISTPMLLIAGAKDILASFCILERGYKNYGGEKECFILEKSNHMMFVDEPVLFISKAI